jgi:hypothetical protein
MDLIILLILDQFHANLLRRPRPVVEGIYIYPELDKKSWHIVILYYPDKIPVLSNGRISLE